MRGENLALEDVVTTELIGDIVRASFARRVAERAELPSCATAESVVAEVMCLVTERLTSGGAHRLVEALPIPVRPLFQRCADHRRGPVRKLDRAELLEIVADRWGVSPRHAEQICQAVLGAVRSYVPTDVADRVGQQLPADLKALWFAPLPPIAAHDTARFDELEAARRDIYSSIERSGVLPAGINPAEAFMAVMCIFSRRLSAGEARHVLLALPNTLRPLVDSCMLHRFESPETFGEQEFVHKVADHLETTPEMATRLSRAVFSAVKRWLPEKDVEDITGQLPFDLRTLWIAG
jgi:uncharacterized protein (DUF2267 family)